MNLSTILLGAVKDALDAYWQRFSGSMNLVTQGSSLSGPVDSEMIALRDAYQAAVREPEQLREPILISHDPFAEVRDKRMSELSPLERALAGEMWARANLGFIGGDKDTTRRVLMDCFEVIDALRAKLAKALAKIAAAPEPQRRYWFDDDEHDESKSEDVLWLEGVDGDGKTNPDTVNAYYRAQPLIDQLCRKLGRAAPMGSVPDLIAELPRVPLPSDLDALVSAFLAWPLPDTVCVDIVATKPGPALHRHGTNLLSAVEAREMVIHLLSVLRGRTTLPETTEETMSVAYGFASISGPKGDVKYILSFLPDVDSVTSQETVQKLTEQVNEQSQIIAARNTTIGQLLGQVSELKNQLSARPLRAADEGEDVDRALGLAALPPIRMPVEFLGHLEVRAKAEGLVLQAYVRRVLKKDLFAALYGGEDKGPSGLYRGGDPAEPQDRGCCGGREDCEVRDYCGQRDGEKPNQMAAPAPVLPNGPFFASVQLGAKGSCFRAQVFGPDGESVADFESTTDPAVSSGYAKLLAAALNVSKGKL